MATQGDRVAVKRPQQSQHQTFSVGGCVLKERHTLLIPTPFSKKSVCVCAHIQAPVLLFALTAARSFAMSITMRAAKILMGISFPAYLFFLWHSMYLACLL